MKVIGYIIKIGHIINTKWLTIELEKNYDDAEHCASYEIIGYHRDRPMTKEEQKEYFTKRYKDITTDIVVSYCKYCNDGVNMSDKKGLHILELLFPND